MVGAPVKAIVYLLSRLRRTASSRVVASLSAGDVILDSTTERTTRAPQALLSVADWVLVEELELPLGSHVGADVRLEGKTTLRRQIAHAGRRIRLQDLTNRRARGVFLGPCSRKRRPSDSGQWTTRPRLRVPARVPWCRSSSAQILRASSYNVS